VTVGVAESSVATTTAAPPARRGPPLSSKFALAFLGLVAAVLVVNGSIDMVLSYREATESAFRVQQEKADAAAERVAQFVGEIESQMGWTTRAEWSRVGVEQRRYDFIRLLRQAPAITELIHVDGQGREQLKLSRLEPDVVGSNADLSADPRLVGTLRDRIWYGPVTFRRGSEPYMAIGLAHVGRGAGATIAEVNLKLVWDVVTAIRVGQGGYAFVTDRNGRLIAHPDMSLVLRDTDLARLPQVAAAIASLAPGAQAPTRVSFGAGLDGRPELSAFALVPKVGWIVFVELPRAEAFAAVWKAFYQTLGLLGLGVVLAGIAGTLLARRMAAPIRDLQAGAEKLAEGDLGQRVPVRSGDEIGTLASRFNVMAERIQEAQETLEAKVEERTADLNESLAQQTATSDILRVISRSPTDVTPVFDAIVGAAVRLLGTDLAFVMRADGRMVTPVAGATPSGRIETMVPGRPIDPDEHFPSRAIVSKTALHLPDWSRIELPPHERAIHEKYGVRSSLYLPLMRGDECLGVLTFASRRAREFSPGEVALAESFRDQAVIAIENVRLFNETREALEQQKASADILGVISRSVSDAQPVFDKILESCKHLFGGDELDVLLVDEQDQLYIAAYVGKARETIAATFPAPVTTSAPGRAIVERRVVQYADVLHAPDVPKVMRRMGELVGYHSVAFAPMMWEGRGIGVVGVARSRGAFSDKELALLQTFADQAVIAIQNARLFDEVQSKTKRLTSALERQTATSDVLKTISRSVFDLQSVLQTLIGSVCRLCEADVGIVYLRDGDVFHARATHNASPEFLAVLKAHPRRATDKSLTPRVIRSGRVEHIPDKLLHPDYVPSPGASQVVNSRTMLGVPVLRGGTVEGVFAMMRIEQRPFADHEIELAETFADQAMIAIENARLFDEVQQRTRDLGEALEQQTATADVLKVISRSAFDFRVVLDALLESGMRLCRGDHAFVFLKEGDGYRLATSIGFTPDYEAMMRERLVTPSRGSLVARVALEKRAVHIPDVLADPDYDWHEAQRLGGYRTMLGVPMIRDGVVIGVMSLTREIAQPFSDRQVDLVATFADQAVIAIENTRLFEEVQARTRELQESLEYQTATSEVLSVISRSPSEAGPVFESIVATSERLCEADFAFIFKLQEDGRYHLHTANNVSSDFVAFRSRNPIVAGDASTMGRAIAQRRAVHVPDWTLEADQDPVRLEAHRMGDIRTTLAAPLLRGGKAIGVIGLARRVCKPFSDRQVRLLETFADQAVIAIENTRLFEEVQARTKDLQESLDQQTATAEVLKVISRSAFDLPAVLRTLAESAGRLCEAPHGAIYLRDDDRFRAAATFGFDPASDAYLKAHPVTPGRRTITPRVALSGEVEHVPDIEADPEFALPDGPHSRSIRAVLGVPLLRNGRVEGVFSLTRPIPGPFSERQIGLVQTFADQAVIAIENSRLFEEVKARTADVQEALEYQTAISDVLAVISRSPNELQPVLRSIAETAARLCEGFDATLFLREGEVLRVGAHEGGIPLDFATKAVTPHWITGAAVLRRKAVHVHDFALARDEFPEGYELHRRHGHRTGLAIPLLRKGEAIGAFMIRRLEVRPFTDKQIAVLQTFADQAVIAINNVRLFEEVQRRTRDLQESLDYQTATSDVLNVISRSPSEVAPVLEAIVKTAARLCEAEYAFVARPRDGLMHLAAGNDVAAEHLSWIRDNPVPIDQTTVTGRVAVERRTIHVPDVLDDPKFARRDWQAVGRQRTVLGVPLLREGELRGVIILARTEVRPFAPRQVELVTTFADQAVIAIENARLFDEVQSRTKELSQSLENLRAAQDRLVQSEKLASLGQLTAGIAHEIKNPLNFVNNFADLSRELVGELDEIVEASNDAKTKEDVHELTAMLRSNLEKVVTHGRRADSIVKNMLAHSREGGGERRMIDLNTTVEEALNLAYHGARAEKQGFNITLEKELDPKAGAVEIYPQEFNRVLINLISNGFYAAHKKKREGTDAAFEPTLKVATRVNGSAVEIRIRDNGTGIPDAVKARIFEPFFTTKPAGEGTGLGLSLSHDIVVKQHGGALDVATEPGAFTEFTITLPRQAAQAEGGGRA
jgi:GAF domain-containing protein/signal transduction histidine kinase